VAEPAVWSIGELAERAGVTVKTVRFYADRGLLPQAARSGGGHRRFPAEALDRLRLIRALRAVELPVPDLGAVLDSDDALGDVVAARLREVGGQLAALRWREAALTLLRDAAPAERAERLRLIGAVGVPPATDTLVRFWRRWLPPRLPARVVAEFLDQTVPELPADPTPADLLAFARLTAVVSGIDPAAAKSQPAAHRRRSGYRPEVLYDGLQEAFALAAPDLRAGRAPRAGQALDCFVAAHAQASGASDTPAYRRRLSRQLAADARIDLYWRQVAALRGPDRPTAGAAHDWLHAALDGPATPALTDVTA
jgi:DNA-binding transcriptional MerR regulator